MSVIECTIGKYYAFVAVFNKHSAEFSFLKTVDAVRDKYVRSVEHSMFVTSLAIVRTCFTCLALT